MKIIKRKLTEAIENADELAQELNIKPQEEVELDIASTKEIADDIIQGAADEEKAVDTNKAEQEAKKVENIANQLILNPYGTARPSKIEGVLQRSLVAALRQQRAGLTQDFQNVLIYGLAGFGKTSIVKKFCKDHNINMFECDAKNLDSATVGGIPYPKRDKNGEITQAPIASNYWKGLEKENTVLFLDELNRAPGRIRGSLLTLINEHKLPAFIENSETGETESMKYYPNILFSVISINPADDIFPDTEDLDPAEVSRNAAVVNQEPNKRDFLAHLKSVYDLIAACPDLSQDDKDVYDGQFNIAKTLLTDFNFEFDSEQNVRDIYFKKSSGKNYLNYRTFFTTLLRSDGKKNDYLDVITKDSGFARDKVTMIKNILSSYQDKQTKGNSVFNVAPKTKQQVKTAVEVADAISAFANSLI